LLHGQCQISRLAAQDQIEGYDPEIMFTIPRLAILSALLLNPATVEGHSMLAPYGVHQPAGTHWQLNWTKKIAQPGYVRVAEEQLGQIRQRLNALAPQRVTELERTLAQVQTVCHARIWDLVASVSRAIIAKPSGFLFVYLLPFPCAAEYPTVADNSGPVPQDLEHL
jgi:hypothetical protein